MDDPGAAGALAIGSGYRPDSLPMPGARVSLPFDPSLRPALEDRMESARLVRLATERLGQDDRRGALSLLVEAQEADTSWSVPVYDMAVLYIEDGDTERALALLSGLSHRYRVSLLLASIYWEAGATSEAIALLEYVLMSDAAPTEALAAAALAYSVAGFSYNASQLWRRVLADPDADSGLRLMAARYAIIEEMRRSSGGGTGP
ncbi:hypothetical protein JW921_05415 [Candidatus Fermentibacterales bacterium]|nr:hypothetical protein [Candidatus Fermentibacterales bacterium]